MARRRGRRSADEPIWNPMPGDYAWTEDGKKCRVVNRDRKEGIHVATVRFQDKRRPDHTSGPMVEVKVRELLPKPPEGAEETGEAGVVVQPRARAATPSHGQPAITFDVINTVNTQLNNKYDFGIHKHGCADVKRDRSVYGCDVYHHYETTPEEVRQAEIEDLAGSGFGEDAEHFTFKIFPCCGPTTAKASARRTKSSRNKTRRNAGSSAEDKNSLQTDKKAATVGRGQRAKAQSTPTTRRTTMARKSSSATKEAPAKGRGRKSTAKAEPEKSSNGNGRRTHEDILDLVPEIVSKLKAGTTMTDIRAEYGAGPVIRKALTEKGYNTKGEKIETPDLTDLSGKKLAKAVADLREDGKAWYYIELATDMGQADLQDLLEENGYSEFASGRVVVARDDDEEEEAPKPKRSRGKAATAEAPAKTRKRGAANKEDEAPAATRRRRGRRTRPSDED